MRVLIVMKKELFPYGRRLAETIEPFCQPKLCEPAAFEVAASVGRGDTKNIFIGDHRYSTFLSKVATWNYSDYLVKWGQASKSVLIRVDDAEGWFSLAKLVDDLEENISQMTGVSRFARSGDWGVAKLPPGVWLADSFLSRHVMKSTGRITDESRVVDLQWRWVLAHFLRNGFNQFHGPAVTQSED